MEAIRNYVEALFAALPKTQDIVQMKLDMLDNLAERYQALLEEGKNEAEATGIVIAAIGTADELRAGLGLPQDAQAGAAPNDKPALDPAIIAEYREYQDHKHGMIAVAVALFICSPIMYQLFKGLGNVMGQVAMFAFIAMGVALCIFSDRRDDYYKQLFGLSGNSAALSEFLEEESGPSGKRLTSLVSTILFPITALIYLCLGFFFDLWHPGWLVFVASACAVAVISAVEQFRGLK